MGCARDLLLARCRSDLHGSPIGEDRQVPEDDLLRAIHRYPGNRAGRLPAGGWDATIGDLDPFAVTDARPDLGPDRMAVLIPEIEGLVAAIGEDGQRQCPD